ncbi:uncharacterized protein FOBCDRAFT_244572 [Fusarium oxysporum Fo47]|uniref:uncharacterized protein n=1 Tax=Fusarium oxysporum Fo47 TaxID=660027 RepID=UPI002869B8CF|nr:uncharacterized protein FOBCDRAFT_244572 [Fusarium oxysporum Fo47]QKD60990.2 hypothetical protein FOBCDRAFT_244572 [Fusarium oxysporum Fo47]
MAYVASPIRLATSEANPPILSAPATKPAALSVGPPRTGSYSMCLALSELDNLEHWMFFGEALNRLFPTLQSYNGKGMVAEDWDQLFGPCEAITDIAGPFSESLIRNYPDAKVILCERPFDRWEPSVTQLLKSNFDPVQNFIRDWVEPLTRGKGQTSYNVDEAISNLRVIYDRHNDTVKELVPPENLLLYKLSPGWEPLCEFLRRDVPDVPFPRVNEGSALARTIWKKQSCQIVAHLDENVIIRMYL